MVVVRACLFGFGEQPVAERPHRRALSRECPIPVETTQHFQMLLTGLTPDGVADERVAGDTELCAEKDGHRLRDHLARCQCPAGITQRTELQGEADPVLRSATPVDMDQVVIRQDMMRPVRGRPIALILCAECDSDRAFGEDAGLC